MVVIINDISMNGIKTISQEIIERPLLHSKLSIYVIINILIKWINACSNFLWYKSTHIDINEKPKYIIEGAHKL